MMSDACADPEGGGGTGCLQPPWKNHKNVGFLSGPDTLKITKLPSKHSMLGHYRHASETPFKWEVLGGCYPSHVFYRCESLFLERSDTLASL